MKQYCITIVNEKERKVLATITSPVPLPKMDHVQIDMAGMQQPEHGDWKRHAYIIDIDAKNFTKSRQLNRILEVTETGKLQIKSSPDAPDIPPLELQTHSSIEEPVNSIPVRRIS
jgi:hypothetical protein